MSNMSNMSNKCVCVFTRKDLVEAFELYEKVNIEPFRDCWYLDPVFHWPGSSKLIETIGHKENCSFCTEEHDREKRRKEEKEEQKRKEKEDEKEKKRKAREIELRKELDYIISQKK